MNKDIVSIIFGDSIAYGLYDKELCGWVNRLRIKLEKQYNNHYIINLAIPGQNSFDILKRFEVELENRYNTSDDFKLIFAFGIKDALILNNDEKHVINFKENVLEIIEKSKKYTDDIYFLGLINPDIKVRKEYNLDNVNYIDNCLKDICEKNNLKYIKIMDLINEDELTDGLHPNSVGHKKISDIVLKNIIGD